MAAHAGENARKTGDFVCDNCGEKVHVKKGESIPKCPNCGNATYSERRNEPANPSTHKSYS
ncbi:MAG: zinc ribbon-containing protein [Planctomycetota bacterium]